MFGFIQVGVARAVAALQRAAGQGPDAVAQVPLEAILGNSVNGMQASDQELSCCPMWNMRWRRQGWKPHGRVLVGPRARRRHVHCTSCTWELR